MSSPPTRSSSSTETHINSQHTSSPHLVDHNNKGVKTLAVPEDERPSQPINEASKAVDHRPGAEAAAGAGLTAGDVGQGAGPGGKGGEGKPRLEKYAYGFFDPQMAAFRKIVFKILGGGTIMTIIIMWLALPLYWGSLWLSNVYTYTLPVRIVDYDGSTIGNAVTQGLLQHRNQLDYFTSSASSYPTTQDVIDNMLDEQVWAAITINSGATSNLQTARQNGDSSYNGSSAISIYYAQARNEMAMNQYVVTYIQQALGKITAQIGAESVANYLQENAGNQQAITALSQAPSTISQPVFYTMYNLRPYDQPVASAITLVGMIYMLIFSFIIAMMNNSAREIIAPFMTTASYIRYRIFTPLILYLPVALLFAMVNLPFRVNFGAHFTYAGGFFLWAFSTYLGMCAMGLAIEFAITVLGPKFIGFFLVAWIIVNVSCVALPHELQPWLYRYGVGLPFYNLSRVVRTIIFNTKNEIGKNLGIVIAWIAVSIITVSLATWLGRRKAVNQHRRALREGSDPEKRD